MQSSVLTRFSRTAEYLMVLSLVLILHNDCLEFFKVTVLSSCGFAKDYTLLTECEKRYLLKSRVSKRRAFCWRWFHQNDKVVFVTYMMFKIGFF